MLTPKNISPPARVYVFVPLDRRPPVSLGQSHDPRCKRLEHRIRQDDQAIHALVTPASDYLEIIRTGYRE
jgi:hypothetical protein